jgi:3-deoxy-manno-octulosonate cytidylyltransferase (CMP-KDO synthetase)
MSRIAIIVPCRLESSRFPRKLLHKIKGKPLVLWVAEKIAQVAPQIPLYFAVDHELLKDCVTKAGFNALMTRSSHVSGTDRIAEANEHVKADFVINVQADEPLVSEKQIQLLVELIQGNAEMATLATPFRTASDFHNPNQVKVVIGKDAKALYFSRAPIPYPRDHAIKLDDPWIVANPCYKHLGLYAYKAELLRTYTSLPMGAAEVIEKLEQLRILENGHAIAVGITEDPTIGIDTLEDAEKFERLLQL